MESADSIVKQLDFGNQDYQNVASPPFTPLGADFDHIKACWM